MRVKIEDIQIAELEPVMGHPDPVGEPGEPGVDGVDRNELVKRLRQVAELTPPICHHDEPEEITVFGKKIIAYCKPFERFQFLLKMAANAIEAEPVRHGRWVDRYDGKYANPLYECSECKEKALYKYEVDVLDNGHFVQALSNACPHCRAKMDGCGGIGEK